MSQIRILGEGRCFYHCMSRVVDRRFIFGDAQKAFFLKTMRKLEAFLDVKVVTYCLMSNHFHLLVEIPDPEKRTPLNPRELLRRLSLLYSKDVVSEVAQELDRAKGDRLRTQKILDRYEERMGRLDSFVKELKQRFSIWYNRRNQRTGTLWEERFKSVLVEDHESTLLMMAAYIDLNPVRAGLVADPKDYRWSGYGEAIGGSTQARGGLGLILEEALQQDEGWRSNWKRTGDRYRTILYTHGEKVEADETTGVKGRLGFDRENVEEMPGNDGQLSKSEALRCRVRYFCDGAVFGTADFVNSVFQSNRSRCGPKRKSGARKMKGADWGKLRVLRDLQKNVMDQKV